MTTYVLEGRRTVVVLLAVLAMIAALLALPATPVHAQTAACPDTIPSAGFTDLAGLSTETVDSIDCIAFYDVTQGIGGTLYGPTGNVTRWQMALFLTRQATAHGVSLPDPPASAGFTDLTGLSAEAVKAINQLFELGITKGTSATTYSPNDNVTRWQMALFLARLVTAAGVALPDPPADAGFTDLTGLSADAVKAINQLFAAGIAKGTSATTYSPSAVVLRWQMALFLARTLQAGGVTPPGVAKPIGVPELVSVVFNAEDTVTEETQLAFTFDEDVAVSAAGEFWLFDAYGNAYPAASAALSSTSDRVVLAIFDTDEYDNATTAVVTGDGNNAGTGAVRDISGDYNINGSVALASQTVSGVDWPDDKPDLVSVSVSAADDDATFTFDQKIDVSDSLFGGFVVVFKDGTTKAATAIETTTDAEAVKVTVSLTTSEAANVVRGFVAAGSADGDTTAATLFNENNVIDVSGASDSGVPDLVSATVVDADGTTKEVEFTFTTQLDSVVATGFELVHADGTTQTSTAAVLKSGDSKTVQATFGGLNSDLVIYAHALPAAVKSFPSLKDNAVDGAKLGPYTFAAGRTAGPDLLTSSGSVTGLAGDKYNLSLTFDEDVKKATLAGANVKIFDEDGVLLPITASTVLDDDDDELVVIQVTAPAATITALKNGDAPVISLEGLVGASPATDDFGYTNYPTSIGCGC